MTLRHLQGVGDAIWADIARKEIGVKEVPGKGSNKRVEQYHGATRAGAATDSVAWCSSFLCWCFEQAGIRSTRSKTASSWLTWGQECTPQSGCVVVFDKSHPEAKGSGHVALLMGVDGDQLLCLGGNQSDQVKMSWYPRSRAVAFRWPDTR